VRSASAVNSIHVWRIETLMALMKKLRTHIRALGVEDSFDGMRVRQGFSMVSVCMHEAWRSEGGVVAMRKTLARLMGDDELARDIQALARGKHLYGIKSFTWAMYVRVYCLMVSWGMWTLVCALQHFRFDVGAILKKA